MVQRESDDDITRPLDVLSGVETTEFEDTIALPSIPASHSMDIIHDMNASFTEPRAEAGGAAAIGDPLDLIGAGLP